MKLSKIYANESGIFSPIEFNSGLNIVLAEIRLPENKTKDTHNLGKTTLSKLIDFCLLRGTSGKNDDFFLSKHKQIFENFIFFLEIKLDSGDFITIRRSVEKISKLSFKKHDEGRQDFTELKKEEWDHFEVPIDRAKDLLDGIFDLTSIKPWSFRTAIGYSLRVHADYNDVFKLHKFKGLHADWKPYVAKILGFDDSLLSGNYELSNEIEEKRNELNLLRRDLVGLQDEHDKIDGMLLIKKRELKRMQYKLDTYDFKVSDDSINKELVDSLESSVANLNDRRYYLSMSLRRIKDSLDDKILIKSKEIELIFKESKIFFEGQLKKDFEDLVKFTKTISRERVSYLKNELEERVEELKDIEIELFNLNKEKKEALTVLRERETFSKYKLLSNKLSKIRSEIDLLERQKDSVTKVRSLSKKITKIEAEKNRLIEEIKNNKDDVVESDRYKNIRLFFDEIIKKVIGCGAVISTSINENGNLEFYSEILNREGRETSEGMGNTYRKLLCIAFDMAVLREFVDEKFMQFIFHDSAFEGLDERKTERLISVMRSYSDHGIQQIVTAIDSDLPVDDRGVRYKFEEDEVVKVLHDEDDDGRLFKMDVW